MDIQSKSPEEQQPQARYYAIDKLTEEATVIKTLAELFPIYRARMGELIETDKARAKPIYELLIGEKAKLLENFDNTRLLLLELGEENLAQVAQKMKAQLSTFNVMTPDYTKLSEFLTSFAEQLPTIQTVNARNIGRLMNNVRMGHYPTDPVHIEMITQGIGFPEGVVTNIFDPCCGTGVALRTMATGNNCITYGAEIDEDRATEAQERLHHVAFGSYFYSRVSNEAFHVMLLNPPYLSVINESGNKIRHEKRFLADSYENLMIGGVLIYIIPYYRLTQDIARMLLDNFVDLSVYRFMGKEFEKFSQIVVLGVRQKRTNGSAKVDDFLMTIDDHLKIPELCELPKNRYILPTKPQKVSVFKGAVFNVVQLSRQLSESKSISKRIQRSALDSRSKSPLLPLNIGQVGLLAGSGFINGLAQCDNPHIIKGRIIKDIKVSEEVISTDLQGNTLVTERKECATNKLVFNILSVDGFKSLTQ